jgi:hypothetical protein
MSAGFPRIAMKKLLHSFLICLLTLFAVEAAAQAPEPNRGPFPQAQLDAMLAPIALYPDSLLSQVMMAASYPRDVAEAARWSRENPELRGAEAVSAVQNSSWDPSVVSLAAFPQILAMMAERPQWTEDLGAAFVGQQREVMDTVQQLRARADAAGTLKSDDHMLVDRRGYDYAIEPASPETMYVPYYDPRQAYGNWQWPDAPPVYWNPWPGYSYAYGYDGLGWGYGITVGPGFWFGALDWPHRYVHYSSYRPWYHRGNFHGGDRWHHDGSQRWANNDGRSRAGYRDRDAYRDRGMRNQVTRPAAAVPSTLGASRARPTYRDQRELRTEPRIDAATVQRSWSPGTPAMQQRAAAPVERSAPTSVQRYAPGPAQRHAPAPVQRSAPVPMQRSAAAPVQRSAPAPVQRVAPTSRPERAERSAPAREPANHAERGSRSMQRAGG